MRPTDALRLRIVTILEPSLCHDCRFAATADVAMEDGSIRAMFHCRRRDCDSWQAKTGAPAPAYITNVR